jgi:hypothetical protein
MFIEESGNLFRFGGFGLPGAFDGLYNQAISDGTSGNLDAADHAVDNRTNRLNIRFEGPLGDAGGFDTHAAQILGFTAMRETSAKFCLFAGKITFTCHDSLLLVYFQCIYSFSIIENKYYSLNPNHFQLGFGVKVIFFKKISTGPFSTIFIEKTNPFRSF